MKNGNDTIKNKKNDSFTPIKDLRSYKQNWSIRSKEGKNKELLFQIMHFQY